MLFVDKILYRHLTSADFNNIEGVKKPEKGGGQTYIDLSGIQPERVVEFFKYAQIDTNNNTGETRSFPPLRIDVIPAGSLQPSPIEIYVRSGRNHYTIRNQFSHRHPSWSPSVGFPTIVGEGKPFTAGKKYSDDQLNPFVLPIVKNLIIYIVRTTNHLYFSDYIYSEHLNPLWPSGVGLETLLSDWSSIPTVEGRGIVTPSKLIQFINSRERSTSNDF